ncbi:hypothetical protein Ancab_019603 [Ancistrocladus abbreviatus]
MFRLLPRSKQVQVRNGNVQMQEQQLQCMEFKPCKVNLEWLHGSFTGFLKFPCPIGTLQLEMQKEGISDCVVRSIGRMTVLLSATGTAVMDRIVTEKRNVFAKWRWGKLIDIDRDTSQRKSFALAHFAIQTQMLEVIHTKVCIKVEEDEFLVTVAKETVDVAYRMGGFEIGTGGNANTASSPSLSISIVPDSFGQASSGDHILGANLPPQTVVHDSNRKLEKEVMIADTDREDRDNDESVSVQVGTTELPKEVTGMIVSSGKLEKHNGGRRYRAQGRVVFSEGCTNPDSSGSRGIQYMGSLSKAHKQTFSYEVECCGPGNRGEEMERLNVFHKPVNGSCSPSARASQHKVISSFRRKAKKKHMEEILQLRLSKRVSSKSKKNRKKETSKTDREDTGEIHGPFSCWDSLHDSHIMNRNEIMRKIWDFSNKNLRVFISTGSGGGKKC